MPMHRSRSGRRPDPAHRQLWQQRLERFQRSGLTVAAFCRREGVSVASLYAWKRRLRDGTSHLTPAAPRLVPVRLVPPPASTPVELVLPSGWLLRFPPGCDPAWLRQLLDLLGVAPC